MSTHTIPTTPGTLCPLCQQPLQVTNIYTLYILSSCSDGYRMFNLLNVLLNSVSAGTLISHEKLLLQINTEREMGNMDYKLGQVSMY